ncbi:MAG: GntR family transcriptional regulator [Sphingobacteriales bacterium]|nr:MAG: GntR family transcriptional regulator [Sphingobacteriales bacterium]
MEFKNNQAIYLQIAEVICDRIILGDQAEEERILSVRDLAVELEVNPNTVMRAYDLLQARDIIVNKRGIGYFVAPDGKRAALDLRKEEFMEKELPRLFRMIHLLQLDPDSIWKQYEKYLKTLKTKAK